MNRIEELRDAAAKTANTANAHELLIHALELENADFRARLEKLELASQAQRTGVDPHLSDTAGNASA